MPFEQGPSEQASSAGAPSGEPRAGEKQIAEGMTASEEGVSPGAGAAEAFGVDPLIDGIDLADDAGSSSLSGAILGARDPGEADLRVVTARGTEHGLVLRIDGKADWAIIHQELSHFLGGRKKFFEGGEVSIEWIDRLPAAEQAKELGDHLLTQYGLTVVTRRRRFQHEPRTFNPGSQIPVDPLAVGARGVTINLFQDRAASERPASDRITGERGAYDRDLDTAGSNAYTSLIGGPQSNHPQGSGAMSTASSHGAGSGFAGSGFAGSGFSGPGQARGREASIGSRSGSQTSNTNFHSGSSMQNFGSGGSGDRPNELEDLPAGRSQGESYEEELDGILGGSYGGDKLFSSEPVYSGGYAPQSGQNASYGSVYGGSTYGGSAGKDGYSSPKRMASQVAKMLGGPDLFYEDDANAKVLFGTLRSGQRVETPFSLVIVGDVNPGADLIAGGDIIVLGSLRGTAHASAYDDDAFDRVIIAFQMQPMQLRIGSVLSRGSEEVVRGAEIARIENRRIVVEAFNPRMLWGRKLK